MNIPARLFSFNTKALIALGLLQLAGLVTLGALEYSQSRRQLEELALEKLSLEMERVSVDLHEYIRNELRVVRMLAGLPHLPSLVRARAESGAYPESRNVYAMYSRQLEEILRSTAHTYPQCVELAFLDAGGASMVSVNKGESFGTAAPDDDGYAGHLEILRSMDPGRVYVSGLKRTSKGPTFWLGAAVADDEGRPGYLLLRVNPGATLDYVRSPVEGGSAYIVDQRGALLYGSAWKDALDSMPASLAQIHPGLARALGDGPSSPMYVACELEAHHGDEAHLCMHGFGRIHYDPDDDSRYWAVVFDAPPAVVFAPLDRLRDRFVLLGAVVIACSLGLTLLFSQRVVVRPVLHLEEAARRVADGDLHPGPLPYAGREDEIGRLYASFGIMVNRLRQATEHLHEQIQARTADLRRSEAELERKNADLERLSQYKSHLLSMVSHELKTPLTSIDGFSRTINQIFLNDNFLQGLDEGQRQVLQKVRHRVGVIGENSDRLTRLVNDLLDFSRIDRGEGFEVRRERTDLGRLLREATDTYAERAGRKGLEVRYDGPLEARGLWASADEGRIRQVLTNLLDNALKFTDSGWIALGAERAGDELEISVSDSGVGLEADELERVFGLFEQGGGDRRQGTGIGLALARYIAERHGGSVRAESAGRGAGSRFVLALPAEDAPAPG